MAAQAPPESPDPELLQTAWDLEPLLDGEGPEGVERRLTAALERAQAFAARYAGRLSELDGDGLREAMAELAVIHELVSRAGYYAALRFSTDTADPAVGALLQRVQEQETAIHTTLLFFELEWAALSQERADQLLAGEGLEFCRHHLQNVRRYREHLLSEPEEKILAEKALTGSSAWTRLFEELTAAIEVELEGSAEKVALDVALSRLTVADREVRRATAEAVTAALAPGLRTRAFLFNTLLADKATDDRLRSYPHWLAARNLSNEASDESVRALLEAVRGRYEIARRWYRLKAKLLGVPRLADYDRMAAVTEDEVSFPFSQAREIVLDCYSSFSGELGALAKRFFDELTLAHELGHGVHFALAARQGVFHQHTPLTLAETASVFGETIVFGRLLEADSAPASRLALLAENLEDTIATVFRQVAMNRFEDLVHTARREEGELSVERFGDLWAESQGEMLGDSVELTEGYRTWWSYIPHFINS